MPPRPKRRPDPLYPHGIEKEYVRYAVKRAKLCHDTTILALRGTLQNETRADTLYDVALIASIFAALRTLFSHLLAPKADEIQTFGRQTQGYATAQVKKSTGQETPQGTILATVLAALLSKWTFDNLQLFRSADTRYLDDVEAVVTGSLLTGATVEEVFSQLGRRLEVSISRGTLIAVDQVGKLNGDVTQSTQQAMGIGSYVWITRRDNRVRDAHRTRDGDVFRWDSPPYDGHPGEAINCRCVAKAVMTDNS